MATSLRVPVNTWQQLTIPGETTGGPAEYLCYHCGAATYRTGSGLWLLLSGDELSDRTVRVDVHPEPFRVHCPVLLPRGFDLRADEPTTDLPAYTYRERYWP